MNSNNNLIKIGTITSAHGIKGEIKIRSFTSPPRRIFDYEDLYDDLGNKIKLEFLREASKHLIARVKGAIDRNTVEKYIGTNINIPKQALPNLNMDEYYIHDLIGLKAIDYSNKKNIGIIKHIFNFGAGDIVEIEYTDKSKEMFLFNKEIFLEINLQEKYIIIKKPISI